MNMPDKQPHSLLLRQAGKARKSLLVLASMAILSGCSTTNGTRADRNLEPVRASIESSVNTVTCWGPPQDMALTKVGDEVGVTLKGHPEFKVKVGQENLFNQVRTHLPQENTAALIALRIQCQEYAEDRISLDAYRRTLHNVVAILGRQNKMLPSAVANVVGGAAAAKRQLADEVQSLAFGAGIVLRTQELTYKVSENSNGQLDIATTEVADIENPTDKEAEYIPYLTVDKRVQSQPDFQVGDKQGYKPVACEPSRSEVENETIFRCSPQRILPKGVLRVKTATRLAPIPVAATPHLAFADTKFSRLLITQLSTLKIEYPQYLEKKFGIKVQPLTADDPVNNRVTQTREELGGDVTQTYRIAGAVLPYQGYVIKIMKK